MKAALPGLAQIRHIPSGLIPCPFDEHLKRAMVASILETSGPAMRTVTVWELVSSRGQPVPHFAADQNRVGRLNLGACVQGGDGVDSRLGDGSDGMRSAHDAMGGIKKKRMAR